MPKDAPILKLRVKHLKSVLEEEKRREAARIIERASADLLGDQNFVFLREAEMLAAIDSQKLAELVKLVNDTKDNLELEYAEAALALGEDDENT